jgi:hypothetical protein
MVLEPGIKLVLQRPIFFSSQCSATSPWTPIDSSDLPILELAAFSMKLQANSEPQDSERVTCTMPTSILFSADEVIE